MLVNSVEDQREWLHSTLAANSHEIVETICKIRAKAALIHRRRHGAVMTVAPAIDQAAPDRSGQRIPFSNDQRVMLGFLVFAFLRERFTPNGQADLYLHGRVIIGVSQQLFQNHINAHSDPFCGSLCKVSVQMANHVHLHQRHWEQLRL